MNEFLDIDAVIHRKEYPTIMMWNRLEARPRTIHFTRSLKAEVRDALWMLTRQWQLGEFKADDAGSPVYSRVFLSSTQINEYSGAQGAPHPLPTNAPLEVLVEQGVIPFRRDGYKITMNVRLHMGRYWMKLLTKKNLPYHNQYVEAFKFELPAEDRTTAHIFAHKEVLQQYVAANGRAMDGYELYAAIKRNQVASTGIKEADASEPTAQAKADLNNLGNNFVVWFEKLYNQPGPNDTAWEPNHLEYQFNCTSVAKNESVVMKATEYYSGHIDWYAFDRSQGNGRNDGQDPNTHNETFIPSRIQSDGMPDSRWWKFEDSKTSFGNVQPATTDVAKLLLMEFGLVFSNDWFILPNAVSVGSLVDVTGLIVKNNFGETFWIKPSTRQRNGKVEWDMFRLLSNNNSATLVLPQSAMKIQEGKPVEEVLLIRDEMSNMVWGIEKHVSLSTGQGEKGGEAALRIRQFHEEKIANRQPAPAPIQYNAPINYEAMTNVPENWIPFVSVRKPGDTRKTQLQRAALLRTIEGDPDPIPDKVRPQTSILREGLENPAGPQAYYLLEEEVPRSGAKVSKVFRRTRWTNGEVYTWLGLKKTNGRGEGSSNLQFDQIISHNDQP